MNVTLDGFMAGSNCELDWHSDYWNEEMTRHISEQLSHADTILLGRVTYKAMATYWPAVAAGLSFSREDIAFAEMMNRYTKIVFSKTLASEEWNNSKFIKGNTRKEIYKLKQETGKDIITYGSGVLVTSLMKLNLVDEYVLWVHPVALGKGKALFKNLPDKLVLKLSGTRSFSSGVVVLNYEPEQAV